MNYRNCIITITCTAVIAIGYHASQQATRPPAHAQGRPVKPPHDAASSPLRTATEVEPTPATKTKKRTKAAEPAVDPAALRNPFEPPASSAAQPPKQHRSRLEEIELSKLRLVAVVRDIDGRVAASLEDQDGIGFFVRPGTAVGPHGGYVSGISPEGITIREPASGSSTTAIPSDLRLDLHPPGTQR